MEEMLGFKRKARFKTNSANWLAQEALNRKRRFAALNEEEQATRIAKMRSYWAIPDKRAEYNANRRKKREEAEEDLFKKTGLRTLVGRPEAVAGPQHEQAGVAQSQFKMTITPEFVKKFIPYEDIGIAIPPEYQAKLAYVFGFSSATKNPVIEIPKSSSEYPFLRDQKAWDKIGKSTQQTYLSAFVHLMGKVGKVMPPDIVKTKDPLACATWYAKENIDPFKVIENSTVKFATWDENNERHGHIAGVTPISVSEQNKRPNAVRSVITQGLLLCLNEGVAHPEDHEKGFGTDVCQKLLKDQFIYDPFGKWARIQTKNKHASQTQTTANKENTLD